MSYEGETRRIDGKVASEFYRTLDLKGFEQAMHELNHSLRLDPEYPLVVTLTDSGLLEVDFLTKPLPYDTFRQLLGY